MKIIGKILWLIVFVLLVVVLYLNFFKPKPCQSVIQYKIGTFDERFGISKADFIRTIETAESIWEKPIAKNLFEYNANGKLTINLIYDNRQKTTQQNAVLKADANKTKNLAYATKQQYLNLEDDYNTSRSEYLSSLSLYQSHQESYASQVEYWNSMGGAPKKEYEILNAQKNDLANEYTALENKRLKMNSIADQINSFINKYNLLVSDVNSNINTINQSAGQEFEEGQYDPNSDTIDIYEFSTNKKLTRVLAHELGHALSLGHNSNPKSIMYSLNSSENMSLSLEDLNDLKTVCKLQ